MTYALMIEISKHGINEQASLAFLLQCGKGHSKPYLPKQNLIQQKSRFAKRGKKTILISVVANFQLIPTLKATN